MLSFYTFVCSILCKKTGGGSFMFCSILLVNAKFCSRFRERNVSSGVSILRRTSASEATTLHMLCSARTCVEHTGWSSVSDSVISGMQKRIIYALLVLMLTWMYALSEHVLLKSVCVQ